MAVKIQFAFQGGGARLALLLPVVQAILEEDGIEITRVAGTSAGAIAAALVAGRADMSALVTHLRDMARNRSNDLRAIFPSKTDFDWMRKTRVLSNLVFRNKAVIDEAQFAAFLENCLRVAKVAPDQAIGKLPPCILISSDVVKRNFTPFSPDDILLQALVDSAAVPFLFRTVGQRFDGGIIDNLPIDHLTPAGKADGEILAVGFNEDAFAAPKASAVSLALSLLDSAMTSKTRSTRRQLGDNFVLSLSPVVGDDIRVESFDVEGFINFMKSDVAYATRLREAKDWLRQRVTEIEARTSNTIVLAPTPSAESVALFGNIAKIADRYHELSNIEFVSSSMEIIAYSLGDPARNDLIRVRDVIRVVEGQANIYVSHLFSANVTDALNARYQITDKQDNPVEFAVLEVPERGQSSKSCVIVFLTPLVANTQNDTVTIVYEQDVPGAMAPLAAKGVDYLSVQVSQGVRTGRVEIGLAIPEAFGGLLLEDGTPARMATLHLDPLAADALIETRGGQTCARVILGAPRDFSTFGWYATELKRGDITRVIYRTTGPATRRG